MIWLIHQCQSHRERCFKQHRIGHDDDNILTDSGREEIVVLATRVASGSENIEVGGKHVQIQLDVLRWSSDFDRGIPLSCQD